MELPLALVLNEIALKAAGYARASFPVITGEGIRAGTSRLSALNHDMITGPANRNINARTINLISTPPRIFMLAISN